MASESGSAVMDMQDEDAEDAVDSDTPLIMEHGYDIAVKVDSPLKQLSLLETYVLYRVRCVCARWQTPDHVRRRYNHFKMLHKRLSVEHPLLPLPPLPPLHTARQQLDRYAASFVELRAMALDAFLSRVARHPLLSHSGHLRLFVTAPQDELERTWKADAAGSVPCDPATNGVRVKDPEFSSAADYLQSLQQKLTTLCSLTTQLHKDSAALAKEYNGMKTACEMWQEHERGALSAAVRGGARAAGRAAAGRGRRGLRARAVLPQLAGYCAAVAGKIRQRDALHAAHVSGTNASETLHNRLEQASEALRSELIDWNGKTKAEIKEILLDIAERQVSTYQQSVIAWEGALKMSTETSPGDIFKTVSKNCVQNLSPSKCRADVTPSATERDLEDFDIDDSDDSGKIEDNLNEDEQSAGDKVDAEVKSANDDVQLVNVVSGPLTGAGAKVDGSFDEVPSLDSEKVDGGRSVLDLQPRSGISDPLSEFAEIDLCKDDM